MADVGILYHAGAAWSGHIMFMQKPGPGPAVLAQ